MKIKYFTDGVLVEESARKQLEDVASLPFIHHHVAVMPDVHWGRGATVGSVIPTIGAIIPAAVGVDIGCGMVAAMTSLKAEDLPDNLHNLRCEIEKIVPHGRTDNGGANDRGAWETARVFGGTIADDLSNILNKHTELNKRWDLVRAFRHLGTLGSGNHFIELCLDEVNRVWIMLHSGSRGIGNALGTHFIELAKKDMERWFINLPDKDLAYIPEGSKNFDDYIEAVEWAQRFAAENRKYMLAAVATILYELIAKKSISPGAFLETAINCHHNYVARENHFGKNVLLTRKGAVRAREGDLGIIPGSMGAKSFIVRGKGNLESFHSCSHGAGRIMSRGEANRKITLEQHIKATEGVECRKDESVIDESPAAYKDIDAVMAAQNDLVEIVHTLKQILCVKG